MTEQFVTYEIAVKLKELGFDEECLAIYYTDDLHKKLLFSIAEKYSSNPEVAKHQARDAIRQINFDKGWAIKVPLWQQVIDFLREKYLLHIEIQSPDYSYDVNFSWSIHKISKFGSLASGESFDYHKVREQAILKAIELCQKK